jgi:hypothetical protein
MPRNRCSSMCRCCRWVRSCRRRRCRCGSNCGCRRGRRPGLRAVRSAGIQIDAVVVHPIRATPNDHFFPGPHRCVIVSGMGHVCDTRASPTVRVRIISAPSVQAHRRQAADFAAPDDHFTARPHCGMKVARGGGRIKTDSSPSISNRTISSPRVQISGARIDAAPDIYLAAAPD